MKSSNEIRVITPVGHQSHGRYDYKALKMHETIQLPDGHSQIVDVGYCEFNSNKLLIVFAFHLLLPTLILRVHLFCKHAFWGANDDSDYAFFI